MVDKMVELANKLDWTHTLKNTYLYVGKNKQNER
jgi:hypothetical protein